MNRRLIFQGSAGEALGKEWTVNAPTVADAFNIVHANNPKKYKDYFEQDLEAEFSVKLAGEALGEAELLLNNLKGEDIVVTPVPKGSKLNAVEKILLAIVLIVVSYYMPGASKGATDLQVFMANSVKMLGMNMLLAGVTQLMMDDPSNDKDEEGAMFGGPAQTVKHGQPVPICYGKLMVGGTPINFGFGVDKLSPSNGLVFSSDNPSAWAGEIYSPDHNARNGDNGNYDGGGYDGDEGTLDWYDQL